MQGASHRERETELSFAMYLFPRRCSYECPPGWLSSGTSGNVHLDRMSLLPGIIPCQNPQTHTETDTETGTSTGTNTSEERSGDRDVPDGIVAACVGDPGGVPVLRDVTVDVLHEQIGGEHAVHEVAPDVAIVEVVLEQRRHLKRGREDPQYACVCAGARADARFRE